MVTEIEPYRGYVIKWTGWRGRFGVLVATRVNPAGQLGDQVQLNLVGNGDPLRYLPQIHSMIDKWAN